jgi:hypothetical protein
MEGDCGEGQRLYLKTDRLVGVLWLFFSFLLLWELSGSVR